MVDGLASSLLLFCCCCYCCFWSGAAFYPVGDDMNMDFLNNGTEGKADMDHMMLMNSDDPKLRSEAEEAFREIMEAKRLSTLQECRRTCAIEYEDAGEFAACNAKCEAANKPGVYAELRTLKGGGGGATEAEAPTENKKVKKAEDKEEQTVKKAQGKGDKGEGETADQGSEEL